MKKVFEDQLYNLDAELSKIRSAHPTVDFSSREIREAFAKYNQLLALRRSIELDYDCCSSDSPGLMCSNCNCWKRARAVAS